MGGCADLDAELEILHGGLGVGEDDVAHASLRRRQRPWQLVVQLRKELHPAGKESPSGAHH